MKKFIKTAKEARKNVGKYYADYEDDGKIKPLKMVERKIVESESGDIWWVRPGYKNVILAWHTYEDDRALYDTLEIVKNPDRKVFTIIEIMAILFSIPFVLSFLLFYVVGIMLMFIAVLIRTGNTVRAIRSIRDYIDSGKIHFTWK